MKKTKVRTFTAQELMEHAMANVAYDLVRAMITVQGIAGQFEKDGVEGSFHGVDLYEALQGIHDSVATALSYILGPDDVEYAIERVKRESGYSIQEAGHA